MKKGFDLGNTQPKKNLFSEFSEENVRRKTQVNSISLAISEIEEFEDNPRLIYDEEDLQALVESIRERGPIDEISVFHFKKGDRYIIADGHRTKRAMEIVYGKDHKIEVIVRREFDEYNDQAKTELLEVGFITSTLKKNLSIYEELKSVKKYIAYMQKINPEDGPYVLSQTRIYKKLGFKKSKAMQLADMIENIPEELWGSFESDGVSTNLLKSFNKLIKQAEEAGDKAVVVDVVSAMKGGKIESPKDLEDYVETRTEIVEHLPGEIDDRDEKISELANKAFDAKKKKEEEENDQDPLGKQGKASKEIKEFKAILKKLQKVMVSIQSKLDELSPQEKEEYANGLLQIDNLIKNR